MHTCVPLTLYQNGLAMRNTEDVTSPSPSDYNLSLVGMLVILKVAFYKNYGRKREVLFFCSVQDTTRGSIHYSPHILLISSYIYPIAF
jgi:hypothetical protein